MAKPKNNLVNPETKTADVTPGIVALKSMLATEVVKKQIKSILKERAGHFMMSLVQLAEGSDKLQICDPQSVLNAAIASAVLNLPIEKNLGFAYLVPYENTSENKYYAQFQLGYKGYIQLALRSGQYKYINSIEIKKGELKKHNYLTGEIELEFIEDFDTRANAETIGYASYIEFQNGFRNTLYMSKEQVKKHALQYSQAYKYDVNYNKKNSNWSKNFDSMALKTVLKLNLSKYGALSVDIQKALSIDGGKIETINENGDIKPDFIDNKENNIIEVEEVVEVTNETKAELLKQADLIGFDLVKKAKSMGISFDTLTKKDVNILQNVLDIETNNRM